MFQPVYTYVDLGWGQKYTIPAYKHYNRGRSGSRFRMTPTVIWSMASTRTARRTGITLTMTRIPCSSSTSVAYQGEQDYITELETKEDGLREELDLAGTDVTTSDMGRRLVIILVLTLLVIVLANVAAFQHIRMKKMQLVDPEEDADDEGTFAEKKTRRVL